MRRSDDDVDASLRVHLRTGDEDDSGDDEEATRGGSGRASWLLNGLLLAIVVVFSVLLLLLLLLAQAPVDAGCDRVPGYEGPPVPPPGDRRVPGKLNVHIVPHTHDDVGWLKTVDQYFTGSNASIQQADVRRIISSVVDELSKDPARTFVYAEMAFFSRWWREQGGAERSRVRALVKEGRLSFVNGGWCMHDEAAAHFADMIHQTSVGHEFIRANFGDDALPRVGWQLDPFGHSAIQATHLGSGVGLDAVFFGRADVDDVTRRIADGAMEFTWRGSRSLDTTNDVKGFVLSKHGNYGPPPGMCFDVVCGDDSRWQDDPDLEDYNVPEMVEAFVNAVEEQAGWFLGANGSTAYGGDVMLTMGTDFTYGAAPYWYDQLDRLIRHVNAAEGTKLNVFYSTPSAYLDAKTGNPHMRWPLKTGDFFPYRWTPHQYWTGYFTSRPTLKAFIRRGGEFLRAAQSLAAVVSLRGVANAPGAETTTPPWDLFRPLAEAIAVAQHHDAVSGTAKQHVTDDYAVRIQRGVDGVEGHFSRTLNAALLTHSSPSAPAPPVPDPDAVATRCPLLNVSACPVTESMTPGDVVAVLAYNPLAWERTEHVRIPMNAAAARRAVVVDASSGEFVPSATLPAPPPAPLAGRATTQLVFSVTLPPLSVSTFFVRSLSENEVAQTTALAEAAEETGASESDTNDGRAVSVSLDPNDGSLLVDFVVDATFNLTAKITAAFYASHDGSDGFVPSGAYVFRPDSSQKATPLGTPSFDPAASRVFRSGVLAETRVAFGDWASVAVRTWSKERVPHAEVEWTVGPIPVEADGVGKEVIVRYSTGLATGGTWATDSNGRDMQPRRRDHRDDWTFRNASEEPVSSNYYPFGSIATLTGDERAGFHLLTDRSQGVGSIRDGELEAMVHRRNLNDDWLGVGEPMNETQCGCRECDCPGLVARGTHLIAATTPATGPRTYRELQTRSQNPTQLAFAKVNGWEESIRGGSRRAVSVFASSAAPRNVHVVSIDRLPGEDCARGGACARIVLAHLFESEGCVGYDEELSAPAKVNLADFFPGRSIVAVEELTLSGTPIRPGDAVVTLEPMQIRAAKVEFA